MFSPYFSHLLLLLFCSGYCFAEDNVDPVVQTPSGTVRGYLKSSINGRKFSAFEGIPYAKPPIGDRRFEEPEPIGPWTGTWSANFSTECAQTSMTEPNKTTGQEDCLYLDVYVPRESPNPEEKLDVIVHIHGGAYLYGSGHLYSHPGYLMDRDVIFINFNYRLGILGFLSTEDDVVPGNNGLKDQVLALKWVQQNIASFGGNPNSVTLTGGSAGASATHLHYFSDESKGLFHRGYSISGCALNPWSINEESLNKAKKLADAVGCPTDSTEELVECLKQRPYEHILEKMPLFFSYLIHPLVPFGPVVEKGGPKPFLRDYPYNLLIQGKVQDLPWIASNSIHEGLFVVNSFPNLDYIDEKWEEMAPNLLDFNYTAAPLSRKDVSQKIKEHYLGKEKISKENLMKLVKVFSDRFFLTDTETAVRLQAKVTKSSVYYLMFGYLGDNNEQKAVDHAADCKYIFGPFGTSPPLTSDETKMKEMFMDMWVSYAKSGKPSSEGLEWKPITDDKTIYLNITGVESTDNKLETREELNDRSFWKSLKFLENENLISNNS